MCHTELDRRLVDLYLLTVTSYAQWCQLRETDRQCVAAQASMNAIAPIPTADDSPAGGRRSLSLVTQSSRPCCRDGYSYHFERRAAVRSNCRAHAAISAPDADFECKRTTARPAVARTFIEFGHLAKARKQGLPVGRSKAVSCGADGEDSDRLARIPPRRTARLHPRPARGWQRAYRTDQLAQAARP